LWSNPTNWVGDIGPSPGDDLSFPSGAVRLSNSNDLAAGISFSSVSFSGSNYVITGNALGLMAGLTNNPSSLGVTNRFNCPITLVSNLTFICATDSTMVLGDVISGSNGLTKAGTGTLTLSAANSYLGATTVTAGNLLVLNGSGLGSITNNALILSGATLAAGNGIIVP